MWVIGTRRRTKSSGSNVNSHNGRRLRRGESAHERSSKFSKRDLEAISQGRCPEGFGAEQKIAFKIATEFRRAGPLSKETWDESVKVSPPPPSHAQVEISSCECHWICTEAEAQVLGVSGTTALIHYVGFYSYVSVILNGFDAGVPVPSKL